MVTKTPDQIMADINAMQLELAKAQQPFLATMVATLSSDPIKEAMASLKTAADGLGTSSTVVVMITNLINVYASTAGAVAREVNGLISMANEPAPPQA